MSSMPPQGPSPGPDRERWACLLIAGLLVVHAVQSFQMFPTLRSIVDPSAPVLVVDHALHLYHGALGSRFLREHGTSWGIDPFFMAGYPETPIWDSSSNLSILFQWLAGGGYRPVAYKVGLLACLILTLALVPAGAIAAGSSRWESALATLLVWIYFWNAFPIALWRSGLFAFILVSAGLVLLVGLAIRLDARPVLGRWATLTAAGAALFFAHVTAPILVLGAVAGYVPATLRRHGRGWLPALGLAMVLAVAVNLFWLVPLWQFRAIRTPSFILMSTDTAWLLWTHYRDPNVDSRLGLILVVLGIAGLVTWWRAGERERVRAATFTGAALLLLLLWGFGSLWRVTEVLEPFRYRIPLHFLLAVPGASFLVQATASLARARGGGRRGLVRAATAWLVALGLMGGTMPWLFEWCARNLAHRRPLVVTVQPEMRALVRWIQDKTNPSARILLEDQLRLLEYTDPESVHWTPLLPELLGPDARQFIGGLYHGAFIAHHRTASFGDFHLGNRPISEWTADDLTAYFDRYNVGWVVCWSPLSRYCLDRYRLATRVAVLPRYRTFGRPPAKNEDERRAITALGGKALADRYLSEGEAHYVIYWIARKPSFFLSGEGRFAAVDANRIELADVIPEAGEVVLSLHWFDTWRTDPPLPAEPYPVPGDPVPFVKIRLPGPIPRIILSNDYGRPGSGAGAGAAAGSPSR
jgi:hypothetical protein